MGPLVAVLLPPRGADAAVRAVLDGGGVPVIDCTTSEVSDVPKDAWVRIRPGNPPPGTGPVVLAEPGDPIPGRPTWLQTPESGPIPAGFAGIVLAGREAGGRHGPEDGLVLLAECPEPGRVILDAGLGPRTAAAAAALGAAGVWVAEAHLGCPEITLPDALADRLERPDDEITSSVHGVRIAHGPTAAPAHALIAGADPFDLARGAWDGDPEALWLLGQGLALAHGLAERWGDLEHLVRGFVEAMAGWRTVAASAHLATDAQTPAPTAAALLGAGTVAVASGSVGSGVLWEEATWLGRPAGGAPLRAALALGVPVHGTPQAIAEARGAELGAPVPATSAAPEAAPAVAIVGVGCRLPGAPSATAFWDNVVRGVSAIGEVPADRWDPALYYDADPNTPDKTYTKIGGFLRDFHFDGRRFRIPPRVAEQIDPVQQITLESVADALQDAGLQVDARSEGRPFDRERCAVILGNALGGEVKDRYAVRLTWPEVEQKLADTLLADVPPAERAERLAAFETAYKADLPVVNEDSMPGELSNVIAGRIANAFDLGGANFTVDAACASSMAAVQAAAKGLRDGEYDLAITGGADRSMNLPTYVKFCKIGALSPDHSAPFDASANGFVMGEGCAILVLKRYEDAVRDGDRIYAVIRGIGASSDGKGKGITAPNIQGQIRALQRAYEDAGLAPWDIDLLEAHGTSTTVGDKVEIEALDAVIGGGHRTPDDPIRLGSVKSMIGHLKAAAGAASLLKAALALHHAVLPPSLGYRGASEDVPLDTIPLRVQTRAEPWPERPNGLRRAGVSAFGFGGTNFHVILESYAGQALPASHPAGPPAPQPLPSVPPRAPAAPTPAPAHPPAAARPTSPLPEGLWATSGTTVAEVLDRLRALASGASAPWEPSAPIRIAAAFGDAAEREEQIGRAIAALEKGSNPDMLRARGIHLQDGPVDGRLAITFTGQGSQYADMGRDLAAAFPLVAETFAEADRILEPTLGRPITAFIDLEPGEDPREKEEVLRHTEYSQPATLVMDVALLRLLAAYGVAADMVAGHSLGEYAAAVAAGIMTFEQALHAVSARGREMAGIQLDDPGKMAGIATGTSAVEEVLAEVDGYVIPANKNCPTQTVIAGESDAVDEACERFRARGVTVYPLPVSHAFHSRIVAPATAPLREVLRKLRLTPPVRPITTNVTAEWYPTGDDAVEQIVDLLGEQISAPVEWTAQIERMYDAGARIFLECGPKRALTGFAVAILKRRPHLALYTNHPKRGGVLSFRDGLAGLLAAGFPVRAAPEPGVPDLLFEPAARRATTEAIQAWLASLQHEETGTEARPDLAEGILSIVAETTGYEVEELDLDYELEADLGIDTVKQAEVFSLVREQYGIAQDPDFSIAEHRTLRSLIDWAAGRVGATRPTAPRPAPLAAPAPAAPVVDVALVERFARAVAGTPGLDAQRFAEAMLPALQAAVQAAFDAARTHQPAPPPPPPPVRTEPPPAPAPARPAPARASTVPGLRIVCTGAAIGLPGGEEVFASDNVARILEGENRISKLGERSKKFLDLSLVRLVKDAQTGEGTFLPVDDVSQVIRLAGTRARFDIGDYGIPASFARALDITTELAMAAGLEALKDAGIPLVRAWQITQSGKRVPRGWMLPEPLRDTTGVIFASAFPGYTQLIDKLAHRGDDGEGRFDRRFLFQVLAMGHSQFAQLIGARGPNTQVNAACASSTQAVALAEDWLRLGRCDRVIVVGADDVTNEQMLPWIGGGFMAAGAATTEEDVTKAALPFDRRRHGMIIGMGAVGLVIERADQAEARGVVPIAELLGSVIANSAFHGTRLDPPHIANQMVRVVSAAAAREGKRPADLAASALFMSHETYTPARGGSAAAEIDALRAAFGDRASQITIANTKGFTGHAMGAGIEDAVALKALQYGRIPPVANFAEPDEQLGDLRISMGEHHRVDYAVRLAAGFGSQLAITVWKRLADGDQRVDPARRAAWLREVTGFDHVVEGIGDRTLRAEPGDADALLPLPSAFPGDDVPPEEPPRTTLSPPPERDGEPPGDRVLGDLVTLISEKTGYGVEELDPEFELEADLGIDTVKQAEIFSELRERYGLQPDDDFRLADHPSIAALADYLRRGWSGPRTTPEPIERSLAPDAPTDFDLIERERPAASDTLADLLGVIAEKTGYGLEDLDPEFELEADLGIDTVKQAEIFSELRERYSLQRDDDFRLADHPSIHSLAQWLEKQRARGKRVDDPQATTLVPDMTSGPATPAIEARTATPAMDTEDQATWKPAPQRRGSVPADATWTEAPLPTAFRVRRPILVEVPRRGRRPLTGLRVQILGAGSAAEAVRSALQQAGAVLAGDPQIIVDAGVDVIDSFHAAKAHDATRPARWLVLTRLGGLETQAPRARAFADGARAGFAKALGREWEQTAATVLDVIPEQSDEEVAAAVLAELGADPVDEVFVGHRRRSVVAYRLEPLPDPAALPDDTVVLITGGARGIGSSVARELASRSRVGLALVGRTPAPDEVTDLAEAKKAIGARLKAGGARVTPAMVERELAGVRAANEIRETLDALRALGAKVAYYAADLSEHGAVPALVEAVKQDFGRIDFAVHGAGIEESRLLADKDDEAFHRVFDAKARGGRALLEGLPPGTAFVSMGSVAGRFGNPGQVDYAAANDALARLCMARSQALHVDWTAWDDVGMAVRGGMRKLLERRGVDLLPAEAGAGLLVDLLAAGTRGEILVAGSLGDFHPTVHHPLLDTVTFQGSGVLATCTLSPETTAWMHDHAIDGVPVLPGVVGLELMTAAAAAASPGLPPVGARHVQFMKPVKLHRDEPLALRIEAMPIDPFEVRCALSSERTLRTGRVQRTRHFEAVVVLGEVAPTENLPSAFFPDEAVSGKAIYERFFHGPTFQVLDRVIGIASDGLVALAHASSDAVAEGMLTAPLVLEAAFQAAGLHRLVTEGQMALPASLESVRLLRQPHSEDRLEIMVYHDGVAYDVDVDGVQGPLLRLRRFRMVDLDTLPPEQRFAEPEGGRPRSFPDRAATTPGAPPRAARPGRGYDDATAQATAGEEDVESWLTDTELSELTARGNERRQKDRIAGRVAAKRALARLTGERPHAIRIHSAESGEPLVYLGGQPGPCVSISHRDGRAIAIAVARGRVGIDLEKIEDRTQAFERDWLTEHERQLVDHDPLMQTLAWSIKESVLKALGVGLAVSPQDVEVRSIGEGGADIRLRGDAERTWRRLGHDPWRVQWRREDGERLVVVALLGT